MTDKTITIVSGLPRSGTSMMMKILEAGGLEILTDNKRTADDDNPKGYFEYEKVKDLEKDQSWLNDAVGKVIKIISFLLKDMSPVHHYKIIFMQRTMNEILASQKQMLIRRGQPTDTISDEKMAKTFFAHLNKIKDWLAQQSNMDVLFINYNDVLANPKEHIVDITKFLGNGLNQKSMAKVVDKNLYRQRK